MKRKSVNNLKKEVKSHMKKDMKDFKMQYKEDKEFLKGMKKKEKKDNDEKAESKKHEKKEEKKEQPKKKSYDKKAHRKPVTELKESPKAEKFIAKRMKTFKKGEMHSRVKGTGPKVTNPKQAIAIAISEARKKGYKVPKKKKK